MTDGFGGRAQADAPSRYGLRRRLRHVFGLDPRSLALFRVALGSLLLLDLLLRGRDLATFYTDRGVLPREHWAQLTHRWHLSLHAASGEAWWQLLLFGIAAIAAIALIAGYRTRWATLISLLLLGSLMNRNPLVLQGGDQLLVAMCFWAVFLPTGMRWSIDAALTPVQRDDPNARARQLEHHAPWFGIASIAVTLQVLYLYFFTALLKTGAPWRQDLDAAFYALSLQHFTTPIGDWMVQHPSLLKGATGYVLGVEFLAPVLVLAAVLPIGGDPERPRFLRLFASTRLIGLALLASLHVAFVLMLHIGLFPLIDLMSLSLLLPAAAWTGSRAPMPRGSAAGGGAVPGVAALGLRYRPGDDGALKRCLLLREFLLPLHTRIEAADPPGGSNLPHGFVPRWHTVEPEARHRVGRPALALICRQRRALRPIGRLLEALPGGGHPRGGAGPRSNATKSIAPGDPDDARMARWLPWRAQTVTATLGASLLAAFFLYVVTAYNVWELPGLRGRMPEHVERPARWLRIDQRWDMFAPYPLSVSIYPLVPGLLRSGEIVDLHRQTSDAGDWVEPARFYSLYDNYRWRKYLGRVDSHRNPAVRRAYGEYQCRRWNTADRPPDQQLGLLEVNFVKFRTTTDGTPKQRSRRMVWRHWCYAEFEDRRIGGRGDDAVLP